MIWVLTLVFIVLDAKYNAALINKGYQINHYWNGTYRAVFYGLLVLLFRPSLTQDLFFIIGAFFSHWLIFNITLNLFRKLAWNYLGKDSSVLDRLESNAQLFVLWCKLALAITGIYIYYHTNLL